MKLFKTRNIVNYGRTQFSFELPSNLVSLRSRIFEAKYRMLIMYSVNLYLCNLCHFFLFLFFLFHFVYYLLLSTVISE